jgi:hypothetical protein
MAVVLVIAEYSDKQLTPIIDISGAIAGYLLGKESGPSPTAYKAPEAAQPPAKESP